MSETRNNLNESLTASMPSRGKRSVGLNACGTTFCSMRPRQDVLGKFGSMHNSQLYSNRVLCQPADWIVLYLAHSPVIETARQCSLPLTAAEVKPITVCFEQFFPRSFYSY